jgi:tetratricopeptide (TPR) repeat protein
LEPKTGDSGSTAPPALSEWDREQRRLRGEPVPEKATAPKAPSVSETILKLLAENGKHFTALKDDERVTVAVAFRGHSAYPMAVTKSEPASSGYFQAIYGSEAREDRVGSYKNLGDLHLKQGQPDKAIEAYTKAVSAAEDEAKANPKATPDQSTGHDQVTDSLTKLAQAYLAAGKMDEARDTMDRVKKSREKPATTANKAPQPGKHTQPARLTVSATKKLLDQVGSGTMTFDEFRKQATVEYFAAGRAE